VAYLAGQQQRSHDGRHFITAYAERLDDLNFRVAGSNSRERKMMMPFRGPQSQS